ncbi:hypothetical protein N7530_012772 [Penicillium desertorum]|uniref:Uncharacterized protein n=1 Tax=Penicillium desertorum TaxID=1303715 RepID=A0A9X0BFR3_9EURO|nr:hypothetical protein N7530_012772 [Penicillium desertorum]
MPLADEQGDREALASENNLPAPSWNKHTRINDVRAEQKQHSYQRFYKALTAHLVAVDTLWLTRAQVYATSKHCDEAFDLVWMKWTDNPGGPLKEKIDLVEVVDFIWGFLGRKCFPVSSVPAWLEGEGEETLQEYLDDTDNETSKWLFFVGRVMQYLRPPRIIELLFSMWGFRGDQGLDRPTYLRHLEFSDVFEGTIEGEDRWVSAGTWFPVTAVEIDVENGLYCMEDGASLVTRWNRYGRVIWPLDARSKVLFRNESAQELVERIARRI